MIRQKQIKAWKSRKAIERLIHRSTARVRFRRINHLVGPPEADPGEPFDAKRVTIVR
jgi:hypothetical protein